MKKILFFLSLFIFLALGFASAMDCCASGVWNCQCGDTVVGSCIMGSNLGPCAEGLKIKGAWLDCYGKKFLAAEALRILLLMPH